MRMIRYYGSSPEREETAVRTNENREVFTPPSFAVKKPELQQSEIVVPVNETVPGESAEQKQEAAEIQEESRDGFGEVSRDGSVQENPMITKEVAVFETEEVENREMISERTEHTAPTEPTLRETSLTTVYQREEQSEEPSETRLRFINVANGYQPVEIYVNNKQFANYIGYGDATEYKNIQGEEIQVSLLGENGYIYLQRSITVTAGKVISVVIINTGFGYGFVVVPEKR